MKRKRRPLAPVVMLPGAERAIDAAKFVHEVAAAGCKAVMVIAFTEEPERFDARLFGDGVHRADLAYLAASLLRTASEGSNG